MVGDDDPVPQQPFLDITGAVIGKRRTRQKKRGQAPLLRATVVWLVSSYWLGWCFIARKERGRCRECREVEVLWESGGQALERAEGHSADLREGALNGEMQEDRSE